MTAKKRPGWYAPLAISYFTHPKTALVAQTDELAPYGFLFLVSEEAGQRLAGDDSAELHLAWDHFAVATRIGRCSGVGGCEQGPIRRCLAAYQHVGWVDLLESDDAGFRVLMRNADAWAGDGKQAKSPPREEEKREEEDEALVRAVFEYWRQVFDQAKARLGPAVARHIRARLREGRTIDELKQAIDGCGASQWHRDTGNFTIDKIMRNDERVIMFIAKAPKRKTSSFDEAMGIV